MSCDVSPSMCPCMCLHISLCVSSTRPRHGPRLDPARPDPCLTHSGLDISVIIETSGRFRTKPPNTTPKLPKNISKHEA